MTSVLMRQANRGFTLVELLVTILISSIVLSSIGLLFGTGLRGNRTASEITTVSQNTEVASTLLQTELRQAGYLGQPNDFRTEQEYVALLDAATAAGGWPFTLTAGGTPFAPIRQLAPNATGLRGECNAGALGSGCIEVVSVRSPRPNNTQPYFLSYVRYEVLLTNGIPTLRRFATGQDRVSCDADFVCTFTGGQPADAVQGVEEFRLFQTTDGTNWTNLTGALAPNARLGVYFRARSLQSELTGTNSGTFTSRLDLPTGVAIPGVAVNDSFRRMERWLDLWLPNI